MSNYGVTSSLLWEIELVKIIPILISESNLFFGVISFVFKILQVCHIFLIGKFFGQFKILFFLTNIYVNPFFNFLMRP